MISNTFERSFMLDRILLLLICLVLRSNYEAFHMVSLRGEAIVWLKISTTCRINSIKELKVVIIAEKIFAILQYHRNEFFFARMKSRMYIFRNDKTAQTFFLENINTLIEILS